jgi:hypothetical protein
MGTTLITTRVARPQALMVAEAIRRVDRVCDTALIGCVSFFR